MLGSLGAADINAAVESVELVEAFRAFVVLGGVLLGTELGSVRLLQELH